MELYGFSTFSALCFPSMEFCLRKSTLIPQKSNTCLDVRMATTHLIPHGHRCTTCTASVVAQSLYGAAAFQLKIVWNTKSAVCDPLFYFGVHSKVLPPFRISSSYFLPDILVNHTSFYGSIMSSKTCFTICSRPCLPMVLYKLFSNTLLEPSVA